METGSNRRQSRLGWLFVGALFALCGLLGALQYRWIGEVAVADRERLRGSLQATLDRISQEFNTEITAACAALMPAFSRPDGAAAEDERGLEREYAARYGQWKNAARHSRLFSRIAVAIPRDSSVALRSLDLDRDIFVPAEWPANWASIRERLEARLEPGPWRERRPPEPPSEEDAFVFERPRFGPRPPDEPPGPFGRRETGWLIVELNRAYLRDTLLPELLQRRLGSGGQLDYLVEVVVRRDPRVVIYRSDPDQARGVAARADASAGLLEIQFDQIFRSVMPGMRDRGPREGPRPGLRRGPMGEGGRWQIFVRHRAGSLDAVVSRARWRNLAVTAAILLLLVATAAALIRFTRNAQRLAELQMNFVAGVSHELRTPLTVIHTAAYNLREGRARNPGQVERYGALIQQESGRLGRLVEQVLRFANANAGRVIQKAEPMSIESVIDDAVAATKPEIDAAGVALECRIDPGLPLVMGDALALQHVFQNLLGNAVKYGAEGGNWIGVFASASNGGGPPAVEIRVADHGPGIPEDERARIFEPFFRGRQALGDQVHGTGLGLNLARKIVEAHGGTIRVESEPMKRTEFIVRIPAAPSDQQDEFTNLTHRG